MGWVNYIVIPRFKIAIVVSRYLNEAPDVELFKRLLDVVDEFNTDALYEPVNELKVTDLLDMGTIAKYTVNLFTGFDIDALLLMWLELVKVDYELISEFEFNERKDEFKDYQVIDIV